MTETFSRPDAPVDLHEEALIPEARQLRRRRWAIGTAILALACLVVGLLVLILNTGGPGTHRTTGFVAGAPPEGAFTTLHLAEALTVSRAGKLYIADAPDGAGASSRVNADRILVRLPDGRFRVVASGLPYISDLTVAPDGTLYIADAGWVRELGSNGQIRTIAGDGRAPGFDRRTGPQPLAAGISARKAPLGSIRSIELAYHSSPVQIALGPHGQLYISNGDQILRLTTKGTLEPVKATVPPSPGVPQPPRDQLSETSEIAIAPSGTIYASGSWRGWSLWAINPDGLARYLTYARQNGGNTVAVQTGPHGAVYAANGDSILLINHGKPQPVFEFKRNIAGQFFWLTKFTIAPSGVIYADEIPGGGGFEWHQQLVAVRNRHVTLLWQEKNRVPR